MKAYHEKEGKYTNDVEALGAYSKGPFAICKDVTMSITLTDVGYEAKGALESFTASVNQKRYLVVSAENDSSSKAE